MEILNYFSLSLHTSAHFCGSCGLYWVQFWEFGLLQLLTAAKLSQSTCLRQRHGGSCGCQTKTARRSDQQLSLTLREMKAFGH